MGPPQNKSTYLPERYYSWFPVNNIWSLFGQSVSDFCAKSRVGLYLLDLSWKEVGEDHDKRDHEEDIKERHLGCFEIEHQDADKYHDKKDEK
jgi:hypothetical protein